MPPLYTALLIVHFLALALGVGATFAMFALRRASAGLEPAERTRFMLRALAVSKNGSYGFGLLLLSGLGMFFLRGPASVLAAGGPAFHAKLTLVVIMAGVLGYSQVLAKRAREAGGGPSMAALPKVSTALLALGVCIVVAATIAFQ
jgi:uncharacterized membrane protein SirB2